MRIDQVVAYLLLWGLIGCGLFALLVVVLFRSGIVYSARKSDGTLKAEIPLNGKLAMLIVPVSYLGLQLTANYFVLVWQAVDLNFGRLFWLNYGLYLILFFFDTFFIDAFVLAVWRPGFLHLPVAMGRESMKTHIVKSLPVGLLIGAVLTLINSTISAVLWIK
jgi:hypothetical protein